MKNILNGLQLIAKYDPSDDLQAEHDQIWCGDIEVCNFSENEKNLMEKWGWFIDEECDSWSHFT